MWWGAARGKLPAQAPGRAGDAGSGDERAVQFLLRDGRLPPASDAALSAVSGPEGVLFGDRVARAGPTRRPHASANAQALRALSGNRADREAMDPFLATDVRDVTHLAGGTAVVRHARQDGGDAGVAGRGVLPHQRCTRADSGRVEGGDDVARLIDASSSLRGVGLPQKMASRRHRAEELTSPNERR